MFKKLLLGCLALTATTTAFAQATCGATAGAFPANNTPMQLLVSDMTTAPVFTTNPSGLPNTDYVVSQQGAVSSDGLGPAIIGAGPATFLAPDYGMTIGDSFYVHAFSYDLYQIKLLIHSLYNNSFFAGTTCCAAADQFFGGFCANLSAQGINDSSDVNSVEDLFAVMNAFSGGTGGNLSVKGLVSNLTDLNSSLGIFGNCSGGITELCFAVDTLSYQFYEVTGVAVTSVTVQGQGGASTITTSGGTLQMEASILPANATNQNVTWSVQNVTGVASIDQAGLLTAYADGNVLVTATAADGSGATGSTVIALSNQSNIAVTGITVTPNPSSISISEGTLQMTATIAPANATATTVVWSLPAGGFIANIDQNGLLTAIGNNDGIVTVRATSTDGSLVFGEATVTLSNQGVVAVTGISINENPGTIGTANGTFQFNATLTPANATNTNVNWSIIGNPVSCDINNMGVATGYFSDTVQVVADALGGTGVFDTTTLEINIVSGIATISNDASLSLSITPNPHQNHFQMEFSCTQTADYQVRLVDMLGKVAWSQTQTWSAGNYQMQINTQNLPSGMYWLQVQHNNGMIAKRLVKN
jgi:uncharacterized protein YjdB